MHAIRHGVEYVEHTQRAFDLWLIKLAVNFVLLTRANRFASGSGPYLKSVAQLNWPVAHSVLEVIGEPSKLPWGLECSPSIMTARVTDVDHFDELNQSSLASGDVQRCQSPIVRETRSKWIPMYQ